MLLLTVAPGVCPQMDRETSWAKKAFWGAVGTAARRCSRMPLSAGARHASPLRPGSSAALRFPRVDNSVAGLFVHRLWTCLSAVNCLFSRPAPQPYRGLRPTQPQNGESRRVGDWPGRGNSGRL